MMDRKATIYDLVRMCFSNNVKCKNCPLYKLDTCTFISFLSENLDKVNEGVLEWCDKNPEQECKTVFLSIEEAEKALKES